MKAAGTILLGYVGPMRTDEMDAIHMDPVDPMPGWEKGMLLAELPAEAVDALLAAAGPQLDIPLIMVELRLHGRRAGPAGAVPNAVAGPRRRLLACCVLGPGGPGAGPGGAGDRPGRARRARSRGRRPEWLINFLGDVSGPDEVAAAYPPATLERLRAVKGAVDPAGVFSFGHAI